MSRRGCTFLIMFVLLSSAVLTHTVEATTDYTCNATAIRASPSFNGASSLFVRQLDDANCTSAFDCFVDFCSCVDGTLSATCTPFQANASTVNGCAAKRADCILASGLAEYNNTNSTCRSWSAMMEDAYYGYYVADNRATARLTRSCLEDTCLLMSDGGSSVVDALNYTYVCAFKQATLPTPRNLTTPAPVPISLPGGNNTANKSNTGVRFQLSGTQWGKTLANNRSNLTSLVKTTIASAVNTTTSDVDVLSIVEGSLVVTFRIVSRSQDAASNAALATMLRDNIDITDLGSFYQATADVVETLTLAGVSVVVISDGTPTTVPCNKWCFVAATAGGFGGLALVGALVVLCVLYCCHANTSSHPSVVEDEAAASEVPVGAEGGAGGGGGLHEPTVPAAGGTRFEHGGVHQPTTDAANGRVIMDRTTMARQGGAPPVAGGGLPAAGGSGWWTTMSSESIDNMPFRTQHQRGREEQHEPRRT